MGVVAWSKDKINLEKKVEAIETDKGVLSEYNQIIMVAA